MAFGFVRPLRSLRRSRVVPVLLAIAFAFVATHAFADGHEAKAEKDVAHIKYRQTVMGAIGAHMGSLGGIMKNGLNLPGHVEAHAGLLAENTKLVAAAFKHQASEGATDAKPEIWTDWAGFEEAIADFEKAARGLETAAASGDPKAVGPAMKALGGSCGGCHDSFRKPKEESYKNQ